MYPLLHVFGIENPKWSTRSCPVLSCPPLPFIGRSSVHGPQVPVGRRPKRRELSADGTPCGSLPQGEDILQSLRYFDVGGFP